VWVDPIKPKLKLPGTERLKPACDVLLSIPAFKYNLRRYIKVVREGVVEIHALVMRPFDSIQPGREGSQAGAYTRSQFSSTRALLPNV
jgi:hypothetical protein